MNGKLWTPEEIELLQKIYPDRPTKEVAKILGRSLSSVYGRVGFLGISKSDEYMKASLAVLSAKLQKSGKAHRFKKGQKSWNAGKKGLHFPGSEKGHFKKGQLPSGTLYDGAITVRLYKTGHRGNKRPYKFIRIAKARWREYHLHVWEQHHGPIPKGMRVCFKDGDSMNCDIANLELLTAQQAGAKMSTNDTYIAMKLCQSAVRGKGKGQYDKELFEKIIRQPALIEAKRQQLLLNKTIKERS